MKKKNVFITEKQAEQIRESKKNPKWNVDPQKVIIVQKYLDNGFKRGKMSGIGEDGYPKEVKIVAMLSGSGEPLKNMSAMQLFYLLQDRFSKIYPDTKQRDEFLWDVMNDWYDKKITKNGLLSKNKF
jgi:hypothetical protein